MKIYKSNTPTLRSKVLCLKPNYYNIKFFNYIKVVLKKTNGLKKGSFVNGNLKKSFFYRSIYFFSNLFNWSLIKSMCVNVFFDFFHSSLLGLFLILNGSNKGFYYYSFVVEGIHVGYIKEIGWNASNKNGSYKPIYSITVNSKISFIEFNKSNKLVRSAGWFAKLLFFNNIYSIIKLPSGKNIYINKFNYCNVGVISNQLHFKECFGKKNMYNRKKMKVRGVAKNAWDHKHGGGEGKTSIGRKSKISKYGKYFFGIKTRKNKISMKYILF